MLTVTFEVYKNVDVQSHVGGSGRYVYVVMAKAIQMVNVAELSDDRLGTVHIFLPTTMPSRCSNSPQLLIWRHDNKKPALVECFPSTII
jgi:hypothetical protein